MVLTPIMHDTPAELAQPFDVQDWKKGECELVPGVTAPQITVVERDYPNTYRRFTSLGPLADKLGNGGKGISWNTEDEVRGLGEPELPGKRRRPDPGPAPHRERHRRRRGDPLSRAGDQWRSRGEGMAGARQESPGATTRISPRRARTRKSASATWSAQPRKIITSPTWSGIESEHVSYTAGYTNVHELIPWRTLTGRQQFYQDHRWFRDFGESLAVYRPPVDTRTVAAMLGKRSNGEPEIVLNFITPHQKWGIHSTYTDNLLMLTLSRGGPIVWISELDAKKVGIVDNDWIELFNLNGAIAARAVVSQRVQEGMCLMYHAQEKIVNVPGSQITGQRGGIHNSVTRTLLKPTHMVGGYAQLSYGFNYYGTVGSNRDEFVIVRKLAKVDWLDHSNPVDRGCRRRLHHEDPRADRDGDEPRQVHRLPHLLCHLQERVDVASGHGIRVVQQRRNQARHRLSEGLGESGALARRLGAQEERQDRAEAGRPLGDPRQHLRQSASARDRRLLRALHLRLRAPANRAANCRPRRWRGPISLISGRPMDKIEWGPNWEEILGGEFDKRSQDYNFEAVQKDIYGQFENTFMMYLPRLCEHCLNPSCVASCPSGSIYKREEDGIVLIDQDKCRGWRMCVSGCPYKKIYYNWTSGKAEKCIFCYPRIEAGPADRLLGNLRRPHPLSRRAALRCGRDRDRGKRRRTRRISTRRSCRCSSTRTIPRSRRRRAPTACRTPGSRRPSARPPTRWRSNGGSPFRSIRNTARCRWCGTCRRCRRSSRTPMPARSRRSGELPDVRSLRIPVRYLANLLTAGAEAPIVSALERMLAMRVYLPPPSARRRRWPGGAGASRPHASRRSRRCTAISRSPITRIAS